MKTTIGQRLKQYRKEKNLTQAELGKLLHLSRQTISKWETDNGVPDLATMLLISELYETDIETILGEKNLTITTAEKDQILSNNDRREKEDMLNRQTRRILRGLLAGLALLVGLYLYNNWHIQQEKLTYEITLYDVTSVTEKPMTLPNGGDVNFYDKAQLADGTIIDLTYETIEEYQLMEKPQKEVPTTIVNKGGIINYYLYNED